MLEQQEIVIVAICIYKNFEQNIFSGLSENQPQFYVINCPSPSKAVGLLLLLNIKHICKNFNFNR